jgi:hypothetical protein
MENKTSIITVAIYNHENDIVTISHYFCEPGRTKWDYLVLSLSKLGEKVNHTYDEFTANFPQNNYTQYIQEKHNVSFSFSEISFSLPS